jgi:Ala-tRNA(Pro) deacylase
MALSPNLQQFLLKQQITYELIAHEETLSASRTAEACHISGDRLAKGVLLRSRAGYLLAVLPASHAIRLEDLQDQLGPDVDVAEEAEVGKLFSDCKLGAVPPVGACYGLDMIVDESLVAQPEVYFEAGDHATLVHMDQDQFRKLVGRTRHRRFSVRQASVSVH